MKLAFLAALAAPAIALGNAADADGVVIDERAATAPQAVDATPGSRIEHALKDLEVVNAHAFKADQERINAFCASANCAKPEPTHNPSSTAAQ